MTCKLMIIDDDEDIRESLVDLLGHEGFTAVGMPDGSAALAKLSLGDYVPDLILLDLYMPKMSGDQVRALLQEDPRWAKIPIIICSGDDVTHELRASVFGVLQKPYDLDRLLELARDVCARIS
jgi:CheY-like chemotaxis protein